MIAPWKKVVRVEILRKLSGARSVTYNHLECGHVTRHTGDAALFSARSAKRRRCKKCAK